MKKIFRYFGITFLIFAPLLLLSCSQPKCSHEEWSSSEVAPTCEEQGYLLWECENCDHSYQSDFTPSTGHTMNEQLVAPTCTQEGYTLLYCDCGYSYKTDFIEPTNHSYKDTVVAPTCESEGYRLHSCQTCKKSYKTEVLSALGHSLQSTTHAATCATPGFTQYSCKNCDLVYRADIVAPLGHKLATTRCVAPTLSENGILTEYCSRCTQSFTTPLNYHDVFVNAFVSGTTPIAKGVDISYHNHAPKNADGTEYHALDWALIKKQGFDFAILRAGYIGFKDPVFEMNYRDAKAAGVELGVYYYTYAKNKEQAIEEAEELIGWLEGKQFEYPIYYDIEDSRLTSIDKETLTECCIAFIETLRDAGYYGALYTNNPWLTNYLDAKTLKEYGELWYARYQRDPLDPEQNEAFTVLPNDDNFTWLESYGAQVGMWQYTACGVIENSGMDQKVDLNYAFKDYPTMIKRFCLNGYTVATE